MESGEHSVHPLKVKNIVLWVLGVRATLGKTIKVTKLCTMYASPFRLILYTKIKFMYTTKLLHLHLPINRVEWAHILVYVVPSSGPDACVIKFKSNVIHVV
jgi:hypothetical protein